MNNAFRYLTIDLKASFSHVSIAHFPEHPFNNTFQLYLPQRDVTIKAEEIQLPFYLKELDYAEINDFHLYLIDRNDYLPGFSGSSAAFGYIINNITHSFTHWLKSLGLIESLKFTIQIQSKNYGVIYFGETPMTMFKSMNYDSLTTHTIQVSKHRRNSHKDYWGFDLDYFFIDNISYLQSNTFYLNKYPAHFGSITKAFRVPKEAFDFLIKYYFTSALFDNESCHLRSNRDIYCNRTAINQLPKMQFIIDGHSFIFTSQELFEEYKEEAYCYFARNMDHDEWIFGNIFLEKYMTTFDYDKNQISFLGHDKIDKIDLDVLFSSKRIMKWVIIVVIIGVLIICGLYYRILAKRRKIDQLNIIVEKVHNNYSEF